MPAAVPAPDLSALLPIFNALPGSYLLLSPDLLIEAVSDEYLAATLTARADLLGRHLFDAFPDKLAAPDARATHNLRASLAQALATGQPHEMAPQHYNVPDPARPGQFVERHWLPRNTPVLDAQGRVGHLIHAVVDVTAQVQRLNEELAATNEELAATNEELAAANEEFLTTNAELLRTQLALRQLNQELEARVAERTRETYAARAAAESQRARLESVFQRAPAAIAVYAGPEFVFELVNPVYQRLLPGRQLLGKPVREAFPEVAGLPVYETLRRVYETGLPHQEQEQLILVAGPGGGPPEEHYFDFTLQARYDGQGRIDGVVGFGFEVTERVLTRERTTVLQADLLAAARRPAQERETYYQIFAQTPAAICIQRGPAHRYNYFNAAYQQFFPDRALLGRPVAEAVPEIVPAGLLAVLDHVYQTGETYFGHEVPLTLTPPGGGPAPERHFTFTYQAYRENGDIVGISTFAYDVSEQVQARRELSVSNQELTTANAQLTRANVDLDNFIYTASHDLKAPITNIEGLLLALQTELPPARQPGDVPHILALMLGAVERFKTTITHLSEVVKLQKEHAQPATDVALAAVVAAVRLDLAPLIAQTGARLEVALPDGANVSFSAKNLRSVVYNLLSNALKYRHPDRPPVVRLRGRALADYVVLEVQDNGLGLEADQQAELFTMFRRLHSHVEGTGLGLYMVKKMVENAGGRVEVSSEVGVGSTFAVHFRR